MEITLLFFLCIASGYLEIPLNCDKSFQNSLSLYLKNTQYSELLFGKTTSIRDLNNNQFSASVNIGFPSQTVSLGINIGSAYTWVKSPGCFPCHSSSGFYDIGKSSTYKNIGIEYILQYFSASAYGVLAADVFTMKKNLGPTYVEFIVVDSDSGFDYLRSDGILGLPYNINDQGASLINNLKNQGLISKRIFSLFFNDKENNAETGPKSALTIGEFSMKYAANQSSPLYILTVNQISELWQVKLNSLTIGDTNIAIYSQTANFDSLSNYILAPDSDSKSIRSYFYKNYNKCNYNNEGMIVCQCSDLDEFPALMFNLAENVTILLDAKYYFFKEEEKCLLLILSEDTLENTFTIGQPVLKKYYSVFDMDDSKIYLTLAKKSKTTEEDESDYDEKWVIIFIVLLVLVITISIATFLYLFYAKKKKNSKISHQKTPSPKQDTENPSEEPSHISKEQSFLPNKSHAK